MVKFEKVKRLEETDIKLPERSTLNSAGYDFFAIEDIIFNPETITRVFTGVKCELMPNQVLILANRSSNPSKKGLVLLNGIGVIDADYYGKELITRIHSIIPYLPLTREEQKRVILESKISKYLQKKIRYQKQFNIELLLEDDFINGLIDKLSNSEQSMRDLNNNILEYLALPEYEILSNPHSYQRLTLTKDTLEDKKNFRLQ